MNNKVYYYKSFSDDVVTNSGQDYKLPDDYVWIRKGFFSRLASGLLYLVAAVVGFIGCYGVLHMKLRNRHVLKECGKSGCYVYGNHTQPVADVAIPGFLCRFKRVYTVVSPSNLGLPVLGKVLPTLGALPIPQHLNQMKEFYNAMETRIEEGGCVVIYPEAHVWPYYTKIRPYPATSFRYPAKDGAPVFAMTTTYQKRRLGKKPNMVVYLDGPFYPDMKLSLKERQKKLQEQVSASMEKFSQNSNCEYIHYEKVAD